MLIVKPDAGDNALRLIAKIWLALGLVGIVFLSIFAIAVFGYGVTVHNRYNGGFVKPAKTMRLLLSLAPIFVSFAAGGALVIFKTRER